MDVRKRASSLALLAIASLMSAEALSDAPFRTINEALETNARGMSLPSSEDGMMTITPCVSCEVKTLHSTASTLYTLRDQAVSFTVFRNALALDSEAPVTVVYAVSTGQLLRVNASIDPPAAEKR
jgi:hypothetical protein